MVASVLMLAGIRLHGGSSIHPWVFYFSRIESVESADEFYSIMGVLSREMVEFGLMDVNELIQVSDAFNN